MPAAKLPERKKKVGKGPASFSNQSQAILASLGLIEWDATLGVAQRLLTAMEAPAVTPAALERLRKVIRYHGDKHA
jgi:hypothetical protein